MISYAKLQIESYTSDCEPDAFNYAEPLGLNE